MVVAAVADTKWQIDDPPKIPGGEETPEKGKEFRNEILILISAPLLTEDGQPVTSLSIQREIDEIVEVLEKIAVTVEITVKVATTQTLLEVFANRFKPLIIHFIGHGMTSSNGTALVLEDKVGIARPFTEDDLKTILDSRREPPCQLALLNACHSQGLANALIKSGVSHVIAVNAEDTILDIAARCFSRHLYQALFNSTLVVDSFLQSRNAVKIADEFRNIFDPKTFKRGINFQEAFKFQLLPENSREHNQSLKLQSVTAGQVIAPSWENTNVIPSYDSTFVGRRQDLLKIAEILANSDYRCVALHGMGGMGKTALAYAAGRWHHERERFRDGVWRVELRNVDSVATAKAKIRKALDLESKDLTQALRNSNLLLILDDLDQLIETEEERLIELLNDLLNCRRVKLLITSRQFLPDEVHHDSVEVCEMGESETREIFSKYAPSETKWGLDDITPEEFESLVRFLDGYPLPIKLAASYMKKTRCTLKMLCEELKIEPLTTLQPISRRENRDNSLSATLELSYDALPPGVEDLFPLLAFFPGGLSRDLANSIWGKGSYYSLVTLLEFSMAEKSASSDDWRVTLPEPARSYAESKQSRGIEDFAPQVLDYYYNFAQKINELVNQEESLRVEQRLLIESSNLIVFLNWGYEKEKSIDKLCRSARITALLSPYWQWVEPGKEPVDYLNLALTIAKKNQDLIGQADVTKVIADNQLPKQALAAVRPKYLQAIDLYQSGLQDIKDNSEQANIQCKIGKVFVDCKEDESAIAAYLQGFELYIAAEEFIQAADTKVVIGTIQEFIPDLNNALESYQKAKQLYAEIKTDKFTLLPRDLRPNAHVPNPMRGRVKLL